MSEWVDVARAEELASGSWRTVDVDDTQIVVFNVDGRYYALEDVCTHIELQRKYWPNLKALMMRNIAERGRSFWGWSDEEWLESIKKGGHEKASVAAVAYLLCGFDSLHELGRYNFLFYGLAIRVFGRKRIRSLFAELEAMLVEWGYRDRTARIYIPRAMCEVLITNRSPQLEDLTFELLQKVLQRRQKKTSTLYLSAVSKVLAHRKIISAPVMRMERPRHPNPHLLKGVPEKWVQSAKYWRANARYSARVRQATYYFLLTVGRWLAAKHPTITTPEQWDRNLAVECLTMITNMRCGDFRAQWVGRKPRNYGKPLTPNGKMLNYTALRVFFADLQAVYEDSSVQEFEPPDPKGMFDREAILDIRKHVNRLPDEFRMPLIMLAVDGLTIPEIAAILEIPEGTVKSRIFYARKRLKESLQKKKRRK